VQRSRSLSCALPRRRPCGPYPTSSYAQRNQRVLTVHRLALPAIVCRLSTQIGVHSIDIATGWSIRGKLDGKVAVITADQRMALAGANCSLTKGLTSSSRVDGRTAGRGRRAHRRNVTGVQADSADLDDLDRLFEIVKQEKERLTCCGLVPAWANRRARRDHRGAVRRRLLAERARHAVHGPKGAAPVQRWRLDLHDRVERFAQGIPQLECVRGEQGRTVRLRTSVGVRTER